MDLRSFSCFIESFRFQMLTIAEIRLALHLGTWHITLNLENALLPHSQVGGAAL